MPRVRVNRQGDLTRTRILDVAEGMFGESGFDGVSLREITSRAAVDLSMVNYHFGSKENLFAQVLARRAAVIHQERAAHLHSAERRAGSEAPSLDDIVKAFLLPVFSRIITGEPAWLSYGRLIAQVSIDPRHASIVAQEIEPTTRMFLRALGTALPDAKPEDLVWGYLYLAGALVQCLAQTDRVARLSAGRQSEQDFDAAFQVMHRYAVAGLQALQSRSRRREYAHTSRPKLTS